MTEGLAAKKRKGTHKEKSCKSNEISKYLASKKLTTYIEEFYFYFCVYLCLFAANPSHPLTHLLPLSFRG